MVAGYVIVGAALLAAAGAHGQIREEPYMHLGVASCATTICHGKIAPDDLSNVRLNEYRTWSTRDRHAGAYRTLESEESRLIAEKLGLPSAQTAKICLDCHADNVAADQRGPRFQIRDGVGCEACHGGAELWIESHTEPGATHTENLARGMYPTEDPVARAEICFSCHLGTRDQFATHRIMGAGHPRLRFELEAFTANQPAHYDVDEDYVQRKGRIEGFNMWLTGQLKAAERFLTLVKSGLFTPPASANDDAGRGAFPELAFYDCHGCHHSMDEPRWSRTYVPQGVDPGSPRLQDQHFRMLEAVASVLEPAAAEQLARAAADFVRAGQAGGAGLTRAADALLAWLDEKESAWALDRYDASRVGAVRRRILERASRGQLADYASAEQAFLAVESLSLYLGADDRQRAALDELFGAVERNETYHPDEFAAAARRILSVF